MQRLHGDVPARVESAGQTDQDLADECAGDGSGQVGRAEVANWRGEGVGKRGKVGGLGGTTENGGRRG